MHACPCQRSTTDGSCQPRPVYSLLVLGCVVTQPIRSNQQVQHVHGPIGLSTFLQVSNAGGGEALIIDTLGRLLKPSYGQRVALHESGHFLVAYLMGILPKVYTLSSLDAFLRYVCVCVLCPCMCLFVCLWVHSLQQSAVWL